MTRPASGPGRHRAAVRRRRLVRRGFRLALGGVTSLVLAVSGLLLVDSVRVPDVEAAASPYSVSRQVGRDAVGGIDMMQMINRAELKADRASARLAREQAARERAAQRRKRALAAAVADPRAAARAMLADYGWEDSEFPCLDELWNRESKWDPSATNPSSGAYGIPQSLPGTKMASAGADWRTNPITQITWGLGYVKARYGSPCKARAFQSKKGFY